MDASELWAFATRVVKYIGICTSCTTAAISLSIFALFGYRLTFHPLAKVPGPKQAAISNVWYALQARNGKVALLGQSLHNRYGRVVRVGPNELWFDTPEAFDAIYSTGAKGLEKSDFYLSTSLSKPSFDGWLRPTFPDTLDLLSERDTKRYRLQRRLIGSTYRASNVAKYEPAIQITLQRLIDFLTRLNGDSIDLKECMHMTAVECLGASVLSWSPGMFKAGTDWSTSKHSYLGWRRKSVFGLFPFMARVDMRWSNLGRVFGDVWKVTFPIPENFRAWFPDVARKVNRRAKAALRANPPKDDRQDLMADLIELHRERPEFTAQYLVKMAMTNFGAGHETMASTLTSIISLLGEHPETQERVRHEILASVPDLPYTTAVVKEAMRLRPVIAMGLPREVPAGGLVIGGLWIPGGTTVGCNPVSLHRNEAICGPAPDEFRPERWLESEARTRMLDRYSLSWGGGSRGCPGRNLAELIVMKAVVAIVGGFRIDVQVPPEEEMPSYFLSMMSGVQASLTPIETVREESAPVGLNPMLKEYYT